MDYTQRLNIFIIMNHKLSLGIIHDNPLNIIMVDL